MKKTKIPKSLKKYFRKRKAKIRRDVLDLKEQEELIKKLYLDKNIKFKKDDS